MTQFDKSSFYPAKGNQTQNVEAGLLLNLPCVDEINLLYLLQNKTWESTVIDSNSIVTAKLPATQPFIDKVIKTNFRSV